MRRAFTLIELLVVIAIIAILAGMLMPALERARAEARKVACTSKVRNVGVYLKLYHQERDGYPWVSAGNVEGAGFNIGGETHVDSSLTIAALYSRGYAEESEIFICPNTDDARLMDGFSTEHSGASSHNDPGYDNGDDEIDWDNEEETTEHRFNSTVSMDCDPSYLIDPYIPFSPNPSRVLYADGPDLARIRESVSDDDSVSDDFANHARGAVALFADGAASFLVMNNDGTTMNTRLDAQADTDIYAVQATDSWEDRKEDCVLGNYVRTIGSTASTYGNHKDEIDLPQVGNTVDLGDRIGPDWDTRP